MDRLKGYVEKIKFRNVENGYTILKLSCDADEVTCVGIFPGINEGEYISIEGEESIHPVYGPQIQMKRYEIITPDDIISIEKYLGSGVIKGIKEATAKKIVDKFGEDTFRVIEQEPEKLAQIKGISLKKARDIAAAVAEKRELRNATILLQQYGISPAYAVKIFERYGAGMEQVIRTNPYRLAEEIHGIGFHTADEIAMKLGVNLDSQERIRAGILYTLSMISGEGNIYYPKTLLIQRVGELLLIDTSSIDIAIDNLAIDRKIIVKEIDGEMVVYLSPLFYMELNCARMLIDLNVDMEINDSKLDVTVEQIALSEEINLDEQQQIAIKEAVRRGVTVITGGPGTGKTTTINTIIKLFENEGLNIVLAAPTGRAAKRMSEATGHDAQTIHRLLELSGGMTGNDDTRGSFVFGRDESNPLEADVIIIDEMSMVDIYIMDALLKAITVGTRLILVGDVNQLPSVGPGNVLKDIILSHQFTVVKLTKIFRQAAMSDIVSNAHKINKGQYISLDNQSKDFFMMKSLDVNEIATIIAILVKEKMPKYVNANVHDIQVLTPMKKGEVGVERLNVILQQQLNPPSKDKAEKEAHGSIFREGDKVMQIKNNYQMEWEIRSKNGYALDNGTGIFNGDCGIIKNINEFASTVTIEFDEGRVVEYKFSQLDEIELAYAITIHKSQGSEYPAVVIPLLNGPQMLMNRNLLYTAVTRAKNCVTIVGSPKMVNLMIDNESENKRYSSLAYRINEMMV